MERCLVLSARRYSFRDDAGKQVEGVTLQYLTGFEADDPDRRGMEPLTITGSLSLYSELRDLPGVYDLDFKQRPGPKGRPTLQVTGLRFVAPSQVAMELAA